jgi:hypothetical protein
MLGTKSENGSGLLGSDTREFEKLGGVREIDSHFLQHDSLLERNVPTRDAKGQGGMVLLVRVPVRRVIERFKTGLQKAFEIFKQARRENMLALSSNWSIIRIPVSDGDVDLARFSSLESVQQMTTLYLRGITTPMS